MYSGNTAICKENDKVGKYKHNCTYFDHFSEVNNFWELKIAKSKLLLLTKLLLNEVLPHMF